MMNKLINFLSRQESWKKLVVGIIIYIIVFSYFSIMRHLTSIYGDPDLGIFNQSFYTAAQYGDLFYNSIEGMSHFGQHISFIFYLLLPFYWLHKSLVTLLILQTAALALGAVPVYLIARDQISEKAGVYFAFFYLLYHPLHGINYDPFHELSFMIAPFLFAIYFLLKRRMLLFWICALLALICKEDISFVFACLGLYIVYLSFIENRKSGSRFFHNPLTYHGLAAFLVGSLWLYLCIYVFIPYFKAGINYGFFVERYKEFGSSFGEVVKNIFFNPLLVLKVVFTRPRILFVLEMLAPLAFLSLWEIPLLMALLPNLMSNILSSFGAMYTTGGRYPAPLVPIIFASAILGFAKIIKKYPDGAEREKKTHKLLITTLIFTLIMTIFFDLSPLRPGKGAPKLTEHKKIALSIAKKIPPEASLSTQIDLFQHTCQRKKAYIQFVLGVDYIFVDTRTHWYSEESDWEEIVPDLLDKGWYKTVEDKDGVMLLKKEKKS